MSDPKEPLGYVCPYCGKECPSGIQWQTWMCCGEIGHAEPVNEENEGQ